MENWNFFLDVEKFCSDHTTTDSKIARGDSFIKRRYVRPKICGLKFDPYSAFFVNFVPLQCGRRENFLIFKLSRLTKTYYKFIELNLSRLFQLKIMTIYLFFKRRKKSYPHSAFDRKSTLTVHFPHFKKHTLKGRTYPSVILLESPPPRALSIGIAKFFKRNFLDYL